MPEPRNFAKCFIFNRLPLAFLNSEPEADENKSMDVDEDFLGRTVHRMISPAAKFPALIGTATPKRSENALTRM